MLVKDLRHFMEYGFDFYIERNQPSCERFADEYWLNNETKYDNYKIKSMHTHWEENTIMVELEEEN